MMHFVFPAFMMILDSSHSLMKTFVISQTTDGLRFNYCIYFPINFYRRLTFIFNFFSSTGSTLSAVLETIKVLAHIGMSEDPDLKPTELIKVITFL